MFFLKVVTRCGCERMDVVRCSKALETPCQPFRVGDAGGVASGPAAVKPFVDTECSSLIVTDSMEGFSAADMLGPALYAYRFPLEIWPMSTETQTPASISSCSFRIRRELSVLKLKARDDLVTCGLREKRKGGGHVPGGTSYSAAETSARGAL